MKIAVCGYSDAAQQDLRLLSLDQEGKMGGMDGVRLGDSPSCLARHGDWLYVGCETEQYARIRAFTLRAGRLVPRGEMTLPEERGLCHLLDTPLGLVGSCYGSGAFFMVSHDLRRLLWLRRTGGHAHWATLHNDRLILTDLGRSAVQAASLTGEMLSAAFLAGDPGPRQWIVRAKDQGIIICEQGDSIIPAAFKDDRILPDKHAISLPAQGYPAGSCVMGDGRLAIPVRGADALVVADGEDFLCWPLEEKMPRSCHWIGGFLLICFQKSDCVISYRVQRGRLIPLDRFPLPGAAWATPLE